MGHIATRALRGVTACATRASAHGISLERMCRDCRRRTFAPPLWRRPYLGGALPLGKQAERRFLSLSSAAA